MARGKLKKKARQFRQPVKRRTRRNLKQEREQELPYKIFRIGLIGYYDYIYQWKLKDILKVFKLYGALSIVSDGDNLSYEYFLVVAPRDFLERLYKYDTEVFLMTDNNLFYPTKTCRRLNKDRFDSLLPEYVKRKKPKHIINEGGELLESYKPESLFKFNHMNIKIRR